MEEMMVCPYDRCHVIIRHRMPYHLVKCEKQYKGPPLEACAYNAMHRVPKEEMQEHLKKCEDAFVANANRIYRVAEAASRIAFAKHKEKHALEMAALKSTEDSDASSTSSEDSEQSLAPSVASETTKTPEQQSGTRKRALEILRAQLDSLSA